MVIGNNIPVAKMVVGIPMGGAVINLCNFIGLRSNVYIRMVMAL